MTAVLAISL